VGVVVSFRLVYDRESGKPKGYGFCEYQDQETALSAMRNLNTRELHGRNLRVDHATRDHGIDPKDLVATGSRSGTVGPHVASKDKSFQARHATQRSSTATSAPNGTVSRAAPSTKTISARLRRWKLSTRLS